MIINTQNLHLTDADNVSYDATSQILKAATAYVNPNVGKMLAVLAKSIELQHMMDYLNNSGVSACSLNNRQIPPEEILKDLRKYCEKKEKEQLDKCLNIMNMAKMYELYKNFAGSGDMASAASAMANASMTGSLPSPPPGTDNDYLKHMQSLLTPEQLQLLNNISNQQNT